MRKQHSRIRILAALLIMAVLGAGCANPPVSSGTTAVGAGSSAAEKLDMVYLRIQTVPEISEAGLEAARPVLLERLRLYAGGAPYLLECFADEDGTQPCSPEEAFVRADVWYPAGLFEDMDVLAQARSMLIRPMKLFLVRFSGGRMRGGFLELPREAIASLEGGSGSCSALDPADYEQAEDEFFWIRMRLAAPFVTEHKAELEGVEGQLAVIQDADMQNMYYGFRMVPGETLDDWYIVLDQTKEKRFQELVLYNYSQAPLETGFLLYDRREPVLWTEPEPAKTAGTGKSEPAAGTGKTAQADGKNKTEPAAGTAEPSDQNTPPSCLVARTALTGDRIRMTFQPEEDMYTDEDWTRVLQAMRTRMDLIGEPYCMGISGLCDRRIVIETENVTRMGYPVMQLLADGGSLHLACTTMSMLELREPDKDHFEVRTEGDRILGLAADVSERHTFGLYKEMQDGLRLGAEEIVLLDDAYHYFRTPMDRPEGDGKLLMTPKIAGIGTSDAADGWFYRLTREVLQQTDLVTVDFERTAGYYSPEGEPLEMPEFPVRK